MELYSFFNLGARWVWLVKAMPPLYPRERYPVPIVQEDGWIPGPVWTGAENLATGIRSPDRPARTVSLYRLRYPGPLPRILYLTFLLLPFTTIIASTLQINTINTTFLAEQGKKHRKFDVTMSYGHRTQSWTGFKPPHSLIIFILILSSFLLLVVFQTTSFKVYMTTI